jgi:hypothetical protein
MWRGLSNAIDLNIHLTKQLVNVTTFPSVTNVTIRIVVGSKGKSVKIEGLGISRI